MENDEHLEILEPICGGIRELCDHRNNGNNRFNDGYKASLHKVHGELHLASNLAQSSDTWPDFSIIVIKSMVQIIVINCTNIFSTIIPETTWCCF